MSAFPAVVVSVTFSVNSVLVIISSGISHTSREVFTESVNDKMTWCSIFFFLIGICLLNPENLETP